MEAVVWETKDELSGGFAPNLVKWIVRIVFGSFFLLGTLHVLLNSALPPGPAALSISIMFVLLCMQLLHVGRHAHRLQRTRLGYGFLVLQAVLIFPPMFIFPDNWVGLPSFLGGSMLLILRPAWGWICFGLVILAVPIIEIATPPPNVSLVYLFVYSMVSTLITGLVVYGLARLARVVRAMDDARMEMAKMAVAAERLRFARDLHDLLGYSLSAISLKSELTHRLVSKNPERAQEELTQIIEISRQALADVRSVASGYRELSLDDEADSARSVLSAADVDVRMKMDHHEIPAQVRTVLATVLREGVTNILRHSKAERCEITLQQTETAVTIDITNDGVPAQPSQQVPNSGSGIQNLSNRLASLDGTLTTGTGPDGRFHLRATIPTGRAERTEPEPVPTPS